MVTKEERILDAAWQLIMRHGFRKVTMSDIADAAGMSRPSLYASFANKESIVDTFTSRKSDLYDIETEMQLRDRESLAGRLAAVFEIWIVEPFASVIDLDNGLDLLTNSEIYAPAGTSDFYARFERHLAEILRSEFATTSSMTAEDTAHILMMATKGLKATTQTLPELRRMIDGLITMTTATARCG
ncbi:MAG TPA: helix-turn-helix domain-containing protein [Thermomicrobiales bacterium]|nr:helix-turn-helix domain-containing protein [Thermomicrobiales bacterium]